MNEMRKLMEVIGGAYQDSKATVEEETYRGISLPRDFRTENIVITPEKNGGVEVYGHSEWLEDGVAFSKNEWEDLVNLIKRHNL